jgi:hypothetical protein
VEMIEAVVLYSSNDSRFFKACINNLLESGVKVHVVTYSHMWSGDLEDQIILEDSKKLFENNSNYNQYQIDWIPGNQPWYWEGIGRYLATQEVSPDSEYILYIDVDEIVEVEEFKKFIQEGEYKNFDSVRLSNYWYFREPTYQATTKEDTVVMCKTSIAQSIPATPGGRNIYFRENRSTLNTNTFIHHYSWVRTKEEMIKKVSNWGHNKDRDWISLIEQEFSHTFNGTDFVHGYQYNIVENKFNL